MRFAKAHAYGNDFLYVEGSLIGNSAPETLARELCDRHTGIGADGLILFEAAGTDATMRLYNADGSRAEVSGNGVRALGALLLRHDPRPSAAMTVHTDGGIKLLTRTGWDGARQVFRASMGMPASVRQATIAVGEEDLDLVLLNMGNPQAVLLGPLPDDARFRQLGGALEWHASFPEGTNLEFAEVMGPDEVRIRIWERGVGPTSSSGTGSCAALVAAAAYGGASRDAFVIAPGGAQRVEWLSDGVYLTGWAEVLFEGEWLRPHL